MVKIVNGNIVREGMLTDGEEPSISAGAGAGAVSQPCGHWGALLALPFFIYLFGVRIAMITGVLVGGVYFYSQMPAYAYPSSTSGSSASRSSSSRIKGISDLPPDPKVGC